MPSYKLKYFNYRGIGEVPRLLFALAGVEFEDIRYTQETWPAEKANTPFGQLPVLEVDGRQFVQSGAIARYLARTFDFYGKGDIEALEVDQVLGIVKDVFNVLVKIFFEEDEARKRELGKEARTEKLPNFMSMFEKILKDNAGTGYFVGDKLSIADLTVFDLCEKVHLFVNFDDYPLVTRSGQLVKENPRIKAWLDKRPTTDR